MMTTFVYKHDWGLYCFGEEFEDTDSMKLYQQFKSDPTDLPVTKIDPLSKFWPIGVGDVFYCNTSKQNRIRIE